MQSFYFKDLEISFTKKFSLQWNDSKSHGHSDGAYWRAIPEEGYSIIGDYGTSNYNDINNIAIMAVVRDIGNEKTALRPPTDYELIWTDKGSGSAMNGSMWRPIAPEGYVAIGTVCNKDYAKPDLNIVRCIRCDLVIPCLIGNSIWNDSGTGANKDFGSWSVAPLDAPAGEIYLAPGTFVAAASHNKPSTSPNAYALRLTVSLETCSPPVTPVLHGTSKPTNFEPSSLAYISEVPWFLVNDPNLNKLQQIDKSPIYQLRRIDSFKLFGFGYNESSTTQSLSWSYTNGVNGSESNSFQVQTGIEIGGEWKLGAIFTASAKFSLNFTHSNSSSKGWDSSTTKQVNVNIPPQKAVAGYSVSSIYKLYRQDGTEVSTNVTYDDGDNIFWAEYPPSQSKSFTFKIN